jgi:hypothetical protein
MDHLNETIQSELDDLNTELSTIQKQMGALSRRQDELLQERAGLLRLQRRHGGEALAPITPAPLGWAEITRGDAILQLLGEAGRPLAPREMIDQLVAHGRDERKHPNAVHNTLTKLKRRGDVVQVGNGRWALAGRGDGESERRKLLLVGDDGPSP